MEVFNFNHLCATFYFIFVKRVYVCLFNHMFGLLSLRNKRVLFEEFFFLHLLPYAFQGRSLFCSYSILDGVLGSAQERK